MMFKNSTKLLFANFSTMWKLLVYYIIAGAVITGISIGFILQISETIGSSGILTELADILKDYNGVVDIFSMFNSVNDIFTKLVELLAILFRDNTVAMCFLSFFLLWLFPYLLSLAEIPTQEVLYGYMSSCTKYGFTSSFIKNLGKSATVQLVKSTLKTIINIIIVILSFYIFNLVNVGGIVYYLVPFVMFATIVVLSLLKEILCAGIIPSVIVYDCGPFLAIRRGLKAISRKFTKTVSNLIMIILLILLINYFFGTFAFIITVPLSIFFFNIFCMVMFFTSQGMRYYVDIETIISPLRLEEKDSFFKLSKII